MKTPKIDFDYFIYGPDTTTGSQVFIRKATIGEFETALKGFLSLCPGNHRLNAAENSLQEFDYLHITFDWSSDKHNKFDAGMSIPDNWIVQVSLHRGASEGYYYHIEAFDTRVPNNSVVFILGKSFGNDEDAVYLVSLINTFLLQIN